MTEVMSDRFGIVCISQPSSAELIEYIETRQSQRVRARTQHTNQDIEGVENSSRQGEMEQKSKGSAVKTEN